jgi:hypothetical protein
MNLVTTKLPMRSTPISEPPSWILPILTSRLDCSSCARGKQQEARSLRLFQLMSIPSRTGLKARRRLRGQGLVRSNNLGQGLLTDRRLGLLLLTDGANRPVTSTRHSRLTPTTTNVSRFVGLRLLSPASQARVVPR